MWSCLPYIGVTGWLAFLPNLLKIIWSVLISRDLSPFTMRLHCNVQEEGRYVLDGLLFHGSPSEPTLFACTIWSREKSESKTSTRQPQKKLFKSSDGMTSVLRRPTDPVKQTNFKDHHPPSGNICSRILCSDLGIYLLCLSPEENGSWWV